MPTSKPCSARATADARPMPESEPVTIAAGMWRRCPPSGGGKRCRSSWGWARHVDRPTFALARRRVIPAVAPRQLGWGDRGARPGQAPVLARPLIVVELSEVTGSIWQEVADTLAPRPGSEEGLLPPLMIVLTVVTGI